MKADAAIAEAPRAVPIRRVFAVISPQSGPEALEGFETPSYIGRSAPIRGIQLIV
jgi:hypothetical protein